jgi:hypothetical protein
MFEDCCFTCGKATTAGRLVSFFSHCFSVSATPHLICLVSPQHSKIYEHRTDLTIYSLYCSNACKSQDYCPDLGDTPLLIPSRAHHSLSSSPTSSVMTTLSITDDLPPQVQASTPFYGTTTAAAVAAAFARTSMPPTPGEAPRKVAGTKHNMPILPPSIRDVNPSALHPPRKQYTPSPAVDVENILHYARRPAHQRSASSSVTSLLLSPAPSAHEYAQDEKTLRTKRKQQRASLPAYFSLLTTPLVVQDDSHIEDWAVPQPEYAKARQFMDTASATPTPDSRGRSRSKSRSRSRGRTFTRRSSHGAAPLDTAESVVQRGRSRVPRELEGRAC